MKKLFGIFLMLFCLTVHSQDVVAANNAIKMGYNFVTVSQNVVFNTAMQSGGTLTLSASIADGGGRNPGDPITLKLVFYNSSNQVVNTVQQAYTMVLGAAAATYSVSATNCGSSCASVAYVSVQFYGKDGGYWAGNYGPYIINPSLTFDGGSNILYNPQFGTYSGTGYAQGWTSSNGWQSCQLYSGAQTCVVDNGALVNGGNYSATGGSTSGTAGGYVAAPTYTSNITTDQQTRKTSALTRQSSVSHNSIYIDQIGNNNTINITQQSGNNQIKGVGQQNAVINGDSNNVTIRQGNPSGAGGKNLLELNVVGGSNTLNLNQGTNQLGAVDAVDSNNHYQLLNLTGSNNNVTTVQKDGASGTGHFMETTISGSSNVIDLKQSNSGPKTLFTNVNGDSNSVTATQSGSGSHYLDVGLVGNSHTVNATQDGSGNHKATISLTNSGASGTVNLNQSGATGQVYNIQQSCTTSGCGATITQY